MKKRIELLQRSLNLRNRKAGIEDGLMGNNTRKAMDTVIGLPKDWNDDHKVVGCIQPEHGGL